MGNFFGLNFIIHQEIIRRVTVTDVNIDVAIPIAKVTAKPLTGPVPK